MNSGFLSWWPCENVLQEVWVRYWKCRIKKKGSSFFLSSSGRHIAGKENIHDLLTNHLKFEFQERNGLTIHWVE